MPMVPCCSPTPAQLRNPKSMSLQRVLQTHRNAIPSKTSSASVANASPSESIPCSNKHKGRDAALHRPVGQIVVLINQINSAESIIREGFTMSTKKHRPASAQHTHGRVLPSTAQGPLCRGGGRETQTHGPPMDCCLSDA